MLKVFTAFAVLQAFPNIFYNERQVKDENKSGFAKNTTECHSKRNSFFCACASLSFTASAQGIAFPSTCFLAISHFFKVVLVSFTAAIDELFALSLISVVVKPP